MLDVCLLGTGGMMPLPYRWLTALLVRYNGSSLLIDCGEGTQIAIKEKGWSFKPIDVICFTHYHGDHISGLPGLLLTMGNADRTEPLTLIGPKGLERVVNALRVIAPELPFAIKYVEITEPEQTFEMNGYRLKAFRVNHNVLCYGYSLEVDLYSAMATVWKWTGPANLMWRGRMPPGSRRGTGGFCRREKRWRKTERSIRRTWCWDRREKA